LKVLHKAATSKKNYWIYPADEDHDTYKKRYLMICHNHSVVLSFFPSAKDPIE
jgi:hypothetical protein